MFYKEVAVASGLKQWRQVAEKFGLSKQECVLRNFFQKNAFFKNVSYLKSY